MIRSSKHTTRFGNEGKRDALSEFVDAGKSAVEFYVNYLWNNRYENGTYILDVGQGQYCCPSMFPLKIKPPSTTLSARALKCASTQACGIVRAVLNKRIKDEGRLEWYHSNNINNQKSKKLEAILQSPPTMPVLENFSFELNSVVVTLSKGKNSFDYWLEFSAMFKDQRGVSFSVPLKNYEQTKKWEAQGKILNGISLSKNNVTLRYDVPKPTTKTTGATIAVDQGLTSMLTTSRGDKFPTDKHNHSLASVLQKMSRRKFGSKGFRRAEAHRKNYINWLVKQLDVSNVQELKLERITNIKFGSNCGRMMKHWSNPLIRDSLFKLCEEQGVLVTLVPNEFNSQRCNKCGWTQKANRKKKAFKCLKCHHENDADANAAANIDIRSTLLDLPSGFMGKKHNVKGFYWTTDSLCNESGEDLTVPHATKT